MVAGVTLTLAILGVTAIGVLLFAVTWVETVGSPGLAGTWQVAGRSKHASRALTEAKHTVTVATGTLLETLLVTVLSVHARWTAILTLVTLDAWWAAALASDSITATAILTCADAVTFTAIGALRAGGITEDVCPAGGAHTTLAVLCAASSIEA